MEKICEQVFYFSGAVNLVYIGNREHGMLIDGGLDAQRMKKIVKQLDQHHFPLTHVLITHAHADHFGGVAWLQKEREVYTYAPKLESALMHYPILEPIYLFNGVNPLSELRNKFIEAEAIRIDEELDEGILKVGTFELRLHQLPGHSYNQLGVGLGNQFLYAADAYFSKEVLDKHGVPFLIDVEQTITSLEKLLQLDYSYYLPGHGQVERNLTETVKYNLNRHHQILEIIHSFISKENRVSLEQIIVYVLTHYNLDSKSLSSWLLYRTSLLAYVSQLIKKSLVDYELDKHQLLFYRRDP